jgi:hypothetical protein
MQLSTKRVRLDLDGTLLDLVEVVAEGNIGAARVLADLVRLVPAALLALLALDDMNMRGSQVWIGFKYHCGEDYGQFLKAVYDRDPAMIAKVNELHAQQGGEEVAVREGASYHHLERPAA